MIIRPNETSKKALFFTLIISLVSLSLDVQSGEEKSLFNRHCSICHQSNGLGSKGRVPALLGPHWEKLSKNRIYIPTVLLNGLEGEISVNGRRYDGAMPSFANSLSDEDISKIANYLIELQSIGERPLYNSTEISNLRQSKPNPSESLALRNTLLED